MSPDDDGWTVVGKDGKFWYSQQGSSASGRNSEPADTSHLAQAATSTASGCLQHISNLQKALKGSEFYASVRSAISQSEFQWTGVKLIRCYGLGSPTKSVEARCQLALLKILSNGLGSQECKCWVYDPVFEAVDEEVCEQLGMEVLSSDAAEEHGVSEPTLFYMPHCDSTLYSDVLDKNWSATALENVAIVGNSFAHMQDRWSTPTFKRRVGRPTRVLPLVDHGVVSEHKLEHSSFSVSTAFNDTSLHWFSRHRLQSVPELFRA